MNTKKPQTDEQVVGESVGRIIGGVAYYFILKRMGAPKYIAYIASSINQHLYNINKPFDEGRFAEAFVNLIAKHRK